jgi:hypothetical protein
MRITLRPAHVLGASCAFGLAASLTACGGGSAVHAHPAGSPAISRQQAAQVLSDYEKTDNQANRDLNDSLLNSVETGPQLSMDSASYKLHRVTNARYAPFTFTKPAFYIPRLTAYPHWFAVDAVAGPVTGKGRPPRFAMLFRQEAPGAPWRLAADPYVTSASSPLSAIRLDSSGYATPIAADEAGRLAVAPDKIVPAHANLLTSGPAAPGAASLAGGPQTNQAYNALQQARGGFAKLGVDLTSRFTPSGQPVYALRTTDGGAIVWYVLQQQETYVSAKPGTLSIAGDLVGLAPAGKVDKRLDTTVLIQYLARIPVRGGATVDGIYRKAVQVETT